MILLVAGLVVVLAVAIALRERTHARRLRELADELARERSGAATEQPGLSELPGLVERARAAGMPVTLSVEGNPPRKLPAVLDVSAFRIVQEALRNAHQHARGAPASVRVSWERRALCLKVRDVGVSERRSTS